MVKTRVHSHPGSILTTEFMGPLHLTSRGLATALRVPSNRISEIVAGERSVTADTAHRLARYFGTSPEFWMNLQMAYDLSKAAAQKKYSDIKISKHLSKSPRAEL